MNKFSEIRHSHYSAEAKTLVNQLWRAITALLIIAALGLTGCDQNSIPTESRVDANPTSPSAIETPIESSTAAPELTVGFSADFGESTISNEIWDVQNVDGSHIVDIKDGYLRFSGAASQDSQVTGMAALPKIYSTKGAALSSFASTQASLMLSSDHTGGFVDMMVKIMSVANQQAQKSIYCHVIADSDNQPVLACAVQIGDQEIFKQVQKVNFGEWHNVQINIDPETCVVTFSMDGTLIQGPTLERSIWGNSEERFILQIWGGRNPGAFATGGVDDIRVLTADEGQTEEAIPVPEASTVPPDQNTHIHYTSPELRATGASGMVLSSDGSSAYLTALGTHEVFVVDLATKAVRNVIDLVEGNFTASKPFRLAITPDGKKVYTANIQNVSVIDTGTNHVIGTMDTQHWVRDIVITPDGNTGFIDIGINRILVFNPATDTITAEISLSQDDRTYAMLVNHAGDRLIVASEAADGIKIVSIDVSTLTIEDQFTLKIDATNQSIPAISQDDRFFYLPSGIAGSFYGNPEAGANKVYVIELAQRRVANQIVGISGGPTSIRLSSDGATGFVTTFSGAGVYRVDLKNNQVDRPFIWSEDLAELPRTDLRNSFLSPDGATLYVVGFDANGILFVDLTQNSIGDALVLDQVDQQEWEIVMSPDGNTVYVTSQNMVDIGGSIAAIDTETKTVINKTALDHYPISPVISADGKLLYYVFSQYLQVMDLTTDQIVNTIRLGEDSAEYSGLVISPDQKTGYAANRRGSQVTVVDLAGGAATQTIEVGLAPQMLAISSDRKRLYISRRQNDQDIGGLVVVDTDTLKVIETIAPPDPSLGGNGYHDLLVVSPDDRQVYWGTNPDRLNVIDTTTNKVTKTITVGYLDPWFQSAGYHPSDMAFISDGSLGYIPLGDSHDTAIFDTKKNEVVHYIYDTGLEPVTIAITPDDRYAYMPTKNGQNVIVLDLKTNQIAAEISIP